MPELVLTFESSAHMECCKASQFSNDAGARIWQAADVGILATSVWGVAHLGVSYFAAVIPSCSFTFARVIPSCSFTFARVIPALFKFFLLKLFGLLVYIYLLSLPSSLIFQKIVQSFSIYTIGFHI